MIIRAMTLTIVVIVFLLTCVVAVLMALWLADHSSPLNVKSVRILTPIVEPGGLLKIEYSVDRLRPCRQHSERYLFDSLDQRHILMDVDLDPIPETPSPFIAVIEIPDYFQQGTARFESVTTYYCNPLHYIPAFAITTKRTIHFQISDESPSEPVGSRQVRP